MKNIEYFNNIINSDLDGETKALALSVLVNSNIEDSNSNLRRCYAAIHNLGRVPFHDCGLGVEGLRPDTKASVMAMVVEAISALGRCRCKDIAKFANDKYFNGIDTVKFTTIKAVTTALVNEDILERQYEEAVIVVEDVAWVNGQRQYITKQKVVEVSYFVFASKVACLD